MNTDKINEIVKSKLGTSRDCRDELLLCEAYEKVFGSEEGKIILKDLLSLVSNHEGVYEPDTHKQSYIEGTRAIIMYIYKRGNMPIELFYEGIASSHYKELRRQNNISLNGEEMDEPYYG